MAASRTTVRRRIVQTSEPDAFYRGVADLAQETGVSEMFSPDEDLESVFHYLVSP